MGLSSVEIYRLNRDQLREECSRLGLDNTGPVRELRCRLVQQLKATTMANAQDFDERKASGSNDLSDDAVPSEILNVYGECQAHPVGHCTPVYVELMRKLPPLTSEEPEAILRFVARLDEVYQLKLCDDRSFITRILPLVPGVILRFFGDCLVNRKDWEQSKKALLREFFPHFIRERLIRDLITFNFHKETTPVREFIDQVFSAARILEYEATEQSLVDRIVMNLHPTVLAQSALIDRPHSRKDLYEVVGIIEEKLAVNRERIRNLESQQERTVQELPRRGVGGNESYASRSVECWGCGRSGHIQRFCRSRKSQPGNGQAPGGSRNPGQQ